MARTVSLGRAVSDALKSAPITDGDKGAVALALRYAHLLDEVRGTDAEQTVISDLGPKLLSVLSSLGMTVAGRGAKPAGGTQNVSPVSAKLDELRARREARTRINST